ncbi:MAG: hypothetical protein WBA63_10980 [Thermomicrobiales bacterium]
MIGFARLNHQPGDLATSRPDRERNCQRCSIATVNLHVKQLIGLLNDPIQGERGRAIRQLPRRGDDLPGGHRREKVGIEMLIDLFLDEVARTVLMASSSQVS